VVNRAPVSFSLSDARFLGSAFISSAGFRNVTAEAHHATNIFSNLQKSDKNSLWDELNMRRSSSSADQAHLPSQQILYLEDFRGFILETIP
jgi:hypothetical protein